MYRVSPAGNPQIVYLIDDDFHVREALQAMLEARALTVKAFEDAEAFIRAHDGRLDGCLLVDQNLPGISGLALIEQLRAKDSRLPAILMSGRMEPVVGSAAKEAGIAAVLAKPLDPNALLEAMSAIGILDS